LVRGNHDYGFSDHRLDELTGGCDVHQSLAYFDHESNVTVCHGHIFGLARTLDLIRQQGPNAELLLNLSEAALDQDLRPAVIAYDIANMVETGLARHGLRGLNTVWERSFHLRATLADQILKLARRSSDTDQATWKLVASLVGTHDNVEVAALLGHRLGGWASFFGHTHEPMAKRVRLRFFGRRRRFTQLVANAGRLHCRRPSCVVAEYPHVTVYQFDVLQGRLRPLHRAGLTSADAEAFERQRLTAAADDSLALQERRA
jgi:hypothetical protein